MACEVASLMREYQSVFYILCHAFMKKQKCMALAEGTAIIMRGIRMSKTSSFSLLPGSSEFEAHISSNDMSKQNKCNLMPGQRNRCHHQTLHQ